MQEDKQKICDKLLKTLRETRELYDVLSLEYDESRELVYATFASGYIKVVNVNCDSGVAMILGIIRQIR